MPRLACPKCTTIVTATEEQRGTIVACQQCGCRIKVPAVKATSSPGSRSGGEGKAASAGRPGAAAQEAAPGSSAVKKPPAVSRPPEPESEPNHGTRDPKRAPARPSRRGDEAADAGQGKRRRKQRQQPSSNIAVGVLGGIGALIGLAVFILIVSGKWVDFVWHPLQDFLENQGIPPIVAIVVTGLIIAIPFTLYGAVHTKSVFLQNIPDDLDYRPARLEDFPNLDEDKLQSYTEAFESLGFLQVMDYTTVTNIVSENKGFARLFVQPEEHCFAEVNQVCMASGKAIPMRCNVTSFLDDGWTVSATDRQASKHSWVMRRPRGVWQSLAGKKVADIVKAHLSLRKQIAGDLGAEVLAEATADAYFQHERENNDERKQVVRRRSAVRIALEMWLFEKNPKREWLGEYANRA
jgi:hypothetical protein